MPSFYLKTNTNLSSHFWGVIQEFFVLQSSQSTGNYNKSAKNAWSQSIFLILLTILPECVALNSIIEVNDAETQHKSDKQEKQLEFDSVCLVYRGFFGGIVLEYFKLQQYFTDFLSNLHVNCVTWRDWMLSDKHPNYLLSLRRWVWKWLIQQARWTLSDMIHPLIW